MDGHHAGVTHAMSDPRHDGAPGMSSSPWPTGFADGVRLFDAGAFFEAHEAFEELLDVVEEDGRWICWWR